MKPLLDIEQFTIENENTTAQDLFNYLETLQGSGFDLRKLPIKTPQTDLNNEQDLQINLYLESMSDSSMAYSLETSIVNYEETA
jgi:hypothetical protein